MFDLLRETETQCWIVEELSGGRHFLQMIFSRFSSYVKMIKNNKKDFLRCLYNIVKDDVKTTTGSNIRTVLLTSGLDPRCMDKHKLKNWHVYNKVDDWTIPLLSSLMEIRADNWQVVFDDEDEFLQEDDINFMIQAVAGSTSGCIVTCSSTTSRM